MKIVMLGRVNDDSVYFEFDSSTRSFIYFFFFGCVTVLSQ